MTKKKPILIVYRIEHTSEKYEKYFAGPYENFGNELWTDKGSDSHFCMKRYPNPFFDKTLKLSFPTVTKNMKKYICGFKSMKQLNVWFSPTEIRRLIKYEFAIVSYKVKIVVDGDKSLMFIPCGKRTILKSSIKSKSKLKNNEAFDQAFHG